VTVSVDLDVSVDVDLLVEHPTGEVNGRLDLGFPWRLRPLPGRILLAGADDLGAAGCEADSGKSTSGTDDSLWEAPSVRGCATRRGARSRTTDVEEAEQYMGGELTDPQPWPGVRSVSLHFDALALLHLRGALGHVHREDARLEGGASPCRPRPASAGAPSLEGAVRALHAHRLAPLLLLLLALLAAQRDLIAVGASVTWKSFSVSPGSSTVRTISPSASFMSIAGTTAPGMCSSREKSSQPLEKVVEHAVHLVLQHQERMRDVLGGSRETPLAPQ